MMNSNNDMLRELQLIMLENMKIIHNICVEHDIKYSLCGGSTVGAIVHKGFVPWDDDIDIMMDRENYNKFCEIVPQYLPGNLELITYKNSKNMRNLIAKIVDNNYQISYQNSTGEIIKMGLYIDITVMDRVPLDAKKRKKTLVRSRLGLLLIGRHVPKNRGIAAKILGAILVYGTTEKFKIRFGEKTEKKMMNAVASGEDYFLGELLIFWGVVHKYDKDMFSGYELMDFEDTKFYVIKNYDRYLWARYNRDYHILPPKEERAPHHGILAVEKIV